MSEPYLVRLKGEAPLAVMRQFGTEPGSTYERWRGRPVEPYGFAEPGYGEDAPYSLEHISVRLGEPGVAAFCVVAFVEFAQEIDWGRVPRWPSYSGGGVPHDVDDARGT